MRVTSNQTGGYLQPIRFSAILLGASCALGISLQTANAATHFVGNCNPHSVSTIQAAVTASNPGDIVAVCAGTYPEEVTINKNLTLEAYQGGAVHVVAPAGGFVPNVAEEGSNYDNAVAQIAVVGPATVSVKGLTVDGSNNNATDCSIDYVGIYYQNAGGAINGNTVENQQLPPLLQGCQVGQGIFAENPNTGTAMTITNNNVSNFDKNGITLNGNYNGPGGGSAVIQKNTVTGVGPTDATAQNGIQIAFGATGSVVGNTVGAIFYNGYNISPYYTASGILLYGIPYGSTPAPAVRNNPVDNAQTSIALAAVNGASNALVPVTGNTITNAMYGVQLASYGPGYTDDFINVSKNQIGLAAADNGGAFDGIDACSDDNTVNSNTVTGVSESGSNSAVHLDDECTESDNSASGVGNIVSHNTLDDACAGVLSGPLRGENSIAGNNVYNGDGTNVVYGSDTCSSDRHFGGSGKKVVPARTLRVQPVGYRSAQQQ